MLQQLCSLLRSQGSKIRAVFSILHYKFLLIYRQCPQLLAHGFTHLKLFCSIMLLFITNHKNMLSLNQTMDGIVKRLTMKKKAHRDVYEVKRTENMLILGASCFELGRSSLGRLLVKEIKMLNYQLKPSHIGFELNGTPFGTFCDPSEVLIVCQWTTNAKMPR